MSNWHNDNTDLLCRAILQLSDQEECYAFLEDICTVREIQDISQRLLIAKMLLQGENYTSIIKQTGTSSATISRISRCIEYGSGGYRFVINKLEKENLL